MLSSLILRGIEIKKNENKRPVNFVVDSPGKRGGDIGMLERVADLNFEFHV